MKALCTQEVRAVNTETARDTNTANNVLLHEIQQMENASWLSVLATLPTPAPQKEFTGLSQLQAFTVVTFDTALVSAHTTPLKSVKTSTSSSSAYSSIDLASTSQTATVLLTRDLKLTSTSYAAAFSSTPHDTSAETVTPHDTSAETVTPETVTAHDTVAKTVTPETVSPHDTGAETVTPHDTSAGTVTPGNTSAGAVTPDDTSPETVTPHDSSAETVTSTSVDPATNFSTTAITSLSPATPSDGDGDSKSYTSVVVLMAGIVLARFGECV